MKAGVPHVEAPVTLLSKMLTLRIHLDAMTMENGPLRVAPGSHAEGLPSGRSETVLNCQAGDVLLMRPLLLHASGHTEPHAGHRRIVHLECAPINRLDEAFEWQHFCPIAK
jgi:ectoine hydroxylase-related dioxygenase (phytanoyl-CoA dioxygenase family)